jgi:hypothetical protein
LLAGENCPKGTGWYRAKSLPEVCASCTGGGFDDLLLDPETGGPLDSLIDAFWRRRSNNRQGDATTTAAPETNGDGME